MVKEISKNPLLHPELIASGIVWKCIQYVFFYLKEDVKKYRDLDYSIKSATMSLKNLISFSNEVKVKGTEFFAFKNLTKETEKDIIIKFKDSINKLFSSKILETLSLPFNIYTNNLVYN